MIALDFTAKAFINSSLVVEELLGIGHGHFEIIGQDCDWGPLVSVSWSERQIEIMDRDLSANGFVIFPQIGVLFPSNLVINDSGFSTLAMNR